MTDQEKLREAIAQVRQYARQMIEPGSMWKWDAVLAAAESTLPKTKMIDVWRVEWCVSWQGHGEPRATGPYTDKQKAEEWAQQQRDVPTCSCVNVVQYAQEVLA